MKKLTTGEFIERARNVHGEQYNYTEVKYDGANKKIEILCHEHGTFFMLPLNHIKGNKCRKCKQEEDRENNRTSFLEKARRVHGGKFDYSLMVYLSSSEKIIIKCALHGKFYQLPYAHLQNNGGCMDCSPSKVLTTLQFITRAEEIHGKQYDYSKVNYISARRKVTIICKKHGEFLQNPNDHLSKKGCAKCGHNGTRVSNTGEFIAKATKIHCNKYSYADVVYEKALEKVTIICPEHGSFSMKASNHLSGQGCKMCANSLLRTKFAKGKAEFIRDARLIHGDEYTYTKVNYINSKTKVEILCEKHGSFMQAPGTHTLQACGCPRCSAAGISKKEIAWLNSLSIEGVITQFKVGKYRVDGYDPKTNTVYEFLGSFWHGDPTIYKEGINPINKKKYTTLYEEWLHRRKELINQGFNVVEMWESDFDNIKK